MSTKKWSARAALVAGAAAIALALSACTAGGSTNESTSAEGTFAGSESETYYMVTFLSGYPFWKETYRGFQDAARQLGVTAQYAGATEYDVNAAVSSLEQIIAKKPDGIAVTAMDADAYVAPIDKAVDAGIPTVTFDSDAPDSKRAAFLGTGNYAAGAEVASQLGERLDGKGKVGVVTLLGQTNINDRVRGFEETLESEYPGIEIVDVVDAGSDETSAGSAASNLIKANPGLDAIFATTVTAEIGSLTAIDESGSAGELKLVTFDSDEVTLKNIQAGTVEFSVAQGPYHMGYWSMMMLYAVKHKTVSPVDDWSTYGIDPLPPMVDTGAFLIDAENVDAYLNTGK